jgi:hypothetical protein
VMQQITRGDKRSRQDQLRIMTDIQDLLPKNNDLEIMSTLGLPTSTYYRYKSKIYKEAKKLWNQICIESLEYRALELKKSLELSFKVNEEIATDPNQSAQNRMQAAELMANAQSNILKLLKEGPEYMNLNL